MSAKQTPQSAAAKVIRKNVTMPLGVIEILERQANENYTNASALLTRYVLDAEKDRLRDLESRAKPAPLVGMETPSRAMQSKAKS